MSKNVDSDRELRVAQAELHLERRSEGGPGRVVGYAAVFGRNSVDLGGWTEEISAGAFAEALRDDDVRALVDHDSSLILGRTSANTLRLAEDRVGLRMEIDLPDTTMGRDIAVSIERGDVTGASFSFRTIEDEWSTKDGKPHRTLKKARLFDVGPVSFPAYPDTQVALRALTAWQKGQEPVVPQDDQISEAEMADRGRRQRGAEAVTR